jgi:methionyl-tRNA formyltransferase
MTSKLDGGPCLIKKSLDIMPTETAEALEPRLSEIGIEAVNDAISMLETWDGESQLGELQDPAEATKAPRLKKSDGLIDFTRTAGQIFNQIRAFQPWPKTFTNWTPENKKPIRLIVGNAAVVTADVAAEASISDSSPGTVAACDSDRLWIQTGEGLISISEIQPSGKRLMPIADFLRGHQPKIGDVFE